MKLSEEDREKIQNLPWKATDDKGLEHFVLTHDDIENIDYVIVTNLVSYKGEIPSGQAAPVPEVTKKRKK